MKKIITIGGATQDIFIHTKSGDIQREEHQGQAFVLFQEGSKIPVQKLHYASGGGATNAAATLTLLGHEVTPACKIANDPAGVFVMEDLRNRGISTQYVVTSSTLPTGTSFILPSPSGNRTILAYRGANGTVESNDIPFDDFAHYDGLYITSLSDASALLLPMITSRARACNLKIALNPGKQQLQKGAHELCAALADVDIFILNEDEARTLYATLQKNKHFSIEAYSSDIMQRGPHIVVVTSGAQGVHVSTRERDGSSTSYFQKSDSVVVTNTVGAGDAFGSCFFGMLMHGATIERALACGIKNSASLLTGNDAKDTLLTREHFYF